MLSGFLILLNAFLLFLIQPILGRMLLPKWGGTAHVWTTCMLFFQTALLAGYLYASASHNKLRLQTQATLHAVLWGLTAIVLTALHFLNYDSIEAFNPPTLSILVELSLKIGLPFVLLASTSSLISAWHYRSTQSHHPYSWYAWSNVTSLAACLLYPLAIEPWLALSDQRTLWTTLYWVLAIGMIGYCVSIHRKAASLETVGIQRNDSGLRKHDAMVIGLSACTSVILCAATSHASQAGVIVPGLWVLPLAVYLATWWLAFSLKLFQSWGVQLLLFYSGAILALCVVIFKLWLPWTALIACCLAAVACIGLACHALVYTLRPAPESMPSFYLRIALGGAIGSLFASVIAPWCFNDYYELHAGLALGAVLLSGYHAQSMSKKILDDTFTRRIAWPLSILSPLFLIGVMGMLIWTPSPETLLERKRDFYGVVSVIENEKQGIRAMLHGRIRHGTQAIDGALDLNQTTYYQTDSGAALAFGWCHDHFDSPLQVAIIGLGTGSLSLYAHSDDSLKYFEISPAVHDLAERHFNYLKSHSGKTQILLGDGRQLLENEDTSEAPKYHLIVVDAFSNDSLPLHLLTSEALELYQSRLSKDGIIAMNITNRNLELAPVLFATSNRVGLKPLLVESKLASYESQSRRVRWLLFFPPDIPLPAWPGSREKLAPSQSESSSFGQPSPAVWTDQFASPVHALRW